jgi:hypothetical protein
VAVAAINMLQQESRASRLSFADMVKRLAEVPPGSHTFISKRVSYGPVLSTSFVLLAFSPYYVFRTTTLHGRKPD